MTYVRPIGEGERSPARGRARWFVTSPPEARSTIERPRVSALLAEHAADGGIVLVAAPSGSGKTLAVASWVGGLTGPVAWLNLTRFDGSPERVSAGIVAAIERAPQSGPDISRALDEMDDMLAVVHEWSVDEAHPSTLVVDQVENIEDLAASPLAELVQKRPRGLRLVVIGSHPPDVMAEALLPGRSAPTIDSAMLAFDEDDLQALARRLNGAPLPTKSVHAAIERTRGWAIATRLEVSGHAATGGRDLEDYVVDDILTTLSSHEVDVIRATTITSAGLDAELATGLSGCPDAAQHLETFARRGFFVDRYHVDGNRVYVWHPAFRRAVVAAELRRDPTGTRDRHERAGRVLSNAHPLTATEHLIAAKREDAAYALLLERWLEVLLYGDSAALHHVCVLFGPDYAERPALLAIRAGCAWSGRDFTGARRLARRSARSAAGTPAERAAVSIAALFTTDDPAALRGHIAAVDEALTLPGVVGLRAIPYALYGLGYAAMRARRSGTSAEETLRSALREAQSIGDARLAAMAAESLGFVLAFEGEFDEALAMSERARPARSPDDWRVFDGGGAATTHGFVAYWRDELADARAAFARVRAQSGGATAYEPVAGQYDALAAAASGDSRWQADALETLRGVPTQSVLGLSWLPFRDSGLAMLALAHERTDDALHYAKSILRSDEFAPVPQAVAVEVLRRAGHLDEARAVIAATSIPTLTRPARVMMLTTDALLRAAAGRADAHVALERALDLAVTQGIRRPFVEPRAELTALLSLHAAWGSRHAEFVAELIARGEEQRLSGVLTAREREILAYLRTTLTLAEIGDTLFLSTNTVKTHVQSLYRKLGVQSRRAAVAAHH